MSLVNCKNLIAIKTKLDNDLPGKHFYDELILCNLYNSKISYIRRNSRKPGERKIIKGNVFAQAVLPFCDPYYYIDSSSLQKIKPELVLAGNYQGYANLENEEATDKMDHLDNLSRENGHEAAHYVQIGQFGMYVASEGKNRVSLYREYKREIVAQLTTTKYPEPSDLSLVRLYPSNIYALQYLGNCPKIKEQLRPWQEIKIGKSPAAVLPFIESVEVLKAYGVTNMRHSISLMAWYKQRKAELYVAHRFYTA